MIPGVAASSSVDIIQRGEDVPPATATFADVVFLSSFDGSNGATSTTDDSLSAHTVSFFGNAKLSTAQKQFGTASLILDGAGDYITAANHSDFQFGAGAFCIEMFVRLDTTSQYAPLAVLDKPSVLEYSWNFNFSNGNLRFHTSETGSLIDTPILVASGMSANVWYHVCAERNSDGLIRVYKDGVMLASATDARNLFASTGPMSIGRTSDGAYLDGYVDEVRITKGAAWYNSDSGFVVPTAAYPRS